MSRLAIDVWSDIACPWCHVGKRRLERALERFAHRDAVDLRWRSFELDPEAPRVREPMPYEQRLARKYGTSPERARDMVRAMTETAAGEGLDFRFDRIRPGNTFDAHRLVHLAATHGLADAAEERLFRAYLGEGEPIGEHAVLARLGLELGLDEDELRDTLAGEAFADEVRADEEEARLSGIAAVPFFRLAGRYGLSGAQPAEVLLQALETTWRELATAPVAGARGREAGGACGPGGCE